MNVNICSREPGWCVSCLRWQGLRRPVLYSLMKLMPLEARKLELACTIVPNSCYDINADSFGFENLQELDLMMVPAETTRSKGLC